MGKAHKTQKETAKPKSKTMHWLLGRGSTLSTENKLLLYKAVANPYGPVEFS
jgi:hypothetical protein